MLVRVGIYKGTTAGTPQHQGKGTYITSSIKAVTQPTAPSTAIHQASTDRHQQHSKEHNTQQPITQQPAKGN